MVSFLSRSKEEFVFFASLVSGGESIFEMSCRHGDGARQQDGMTRCSFSVLFGSLLRLKHEQPMCVENEIALSCGGGQQRARLGLFLRLLLRHGALINCVRTSTKMRIVHDTFLIGEELCMQEKSNGITLLLRVAFMFNSRSSSICIVVAAGNSNVE